MRRLLPLAVAAVVLGTAAPAFAFGTTPDPNYGTNGVVTLPNVAFQAQVLQVGSSTYVVAGTLNGAVTIERLDEAGAIDSSYGSAGTFRTPDGTASVVATTATADGSVYAVLSPFGPSSRFRVLRVTSGGVADASFGANGFAWTPTAGTDLPLGVTVDPNGRVYVSGERNPRRGKPFAFVLRLTATGSIDRSFAGDGRRDFTRLPNSALAGMAAGPRSVVAVGAAGPRGIATRMRNNGSIDRRFGDHGFFSVSSRRGPTALTSVSLTPALKVAGLREVRTTKQDSVISGTLPGRLHAVALCTGCTTTVFPVITADGSVVSAGFHQHRRTSREFVVGMLPSGAPDTGISPTGWALVGPVGQAIPLSLALDGTAVLVSSMSGSSATGATIARYLPNP